MTIADHHADRPGTWPGGGQRHFSGPPERERRPIECHRNRIAAHRPRHHHSGAPHAAPARRAGFSRDPVRQSMCVGPQRVARQHLRQGVSRGRPRLHQKPGGRESQPGVPDIGAIQHLLEQCRGRRGVAAKLCRCEHQRDRAIGGRQPVGAVQPAQCLRPVARCERRLAARERLLDLPGQNLMWVGFVVGGERHERRRQTSSATASFGAGGKAARSAFASCRPCATARSNQTRASAGLCSPATLRIRKRPNIICA